MQKVTFVALVLAAIIVGTFASTLAEQRSQFEAFKRKHEKTYTGAEHDRRFAVFQDNLKRIAHLNKLDSGAVYAVNKFADLTAEEFSNMYLSKHTPKLDLPVAEPLDVTSAPDSIDWVPIASFCYRVHLSHLRLDHQGCSHPRKESGSVRFVLGVLHHV